MSTIPRMNRAYFQKLLIVILCLVIFAYLISALKELCLLILIGFCIAYLLEPAIQFFERYKIRRPIGLLILSLLLTLLISSLFISAIPTVVREFSSLRAQFPKYLNEAHDIFTEWSMILHTKFGLPEGYAAQLSTATERLKSYAPKIFTVLIPNVIKMLFKGYSIGLTIFNLFLLPFIIYYLVVDFRNIKNTFLRFFPPVKRQYVSNLLSEINIQVGAFVKGQFLVCTILFIFYTCGLGLLQIELWFLIAFIAGYGNFIPYFGFVSGILLATLMTMVTYGDFFHLILTWSVFGIAQVLEGTFITPRIIGNSVGLSPLVIMLALVAGGTLFGLLGICLAVPLAAIIRVLGKAVLQHLYGGE